MDHLAANEIVRAVLGTTEAIAASDAAKVDVTQTEAADVEEATSAASQEEPPSEREYGGERSVFVGLAGGLVTQPGGQQWELLYLDLALMTWMLVQPDAILHHIRVKDRFSEEVEWDMIWVKATASVGYGSGPVSDGQFLTGDFVRARDFATTPVGGTFGPEVGAFQVGTSQNCCTRKSR